MSIKVLTAQILDKIPEIRKWQKKFMLELFTILLRVRGRHNFENLSRYSSFNEATYRYWYGEKFDFLRFNTELIKSLPEEERLIAFDPSYLPKSGKHTPGLGYFWSGCAGATKYGLEIAGFASVGMETQTAMHLYAKQTIGHQQYDTLLEYYGSLIIQMADSLKAVSSLIVADAYFSRNPFVNTVLEQGFDLVSKLRSNACLFYPYSGEKPKRRGRPPKYDGKVDWHDLDPRHFSLCLDEENFKAYQGVVYVKAFKRKVKCLMVHVNRKDGSKNVQAFFSTDLQMEGEKILQTYKLRFQRGRPAIEFLYRDAKQFTGLTQCQARSEQKIDTHVNASLTAVALAKAVHYLALPKNERKTFSLSSIKNQYFNEHLLERFFVEFGIPPELNKNSPKYKQLYNYGCIAA